MSRYAGQSGAIEADFRSLWERKKGVVKGQPASRHHHDLIESDTCMILVVQTFCNGLPRFGNTCRFRVSCPTRFECSNGRVNNFLGRIKIGFPRIEVDDVMPLALQLAGLEEHIDERYRGDHVLFSGGLGLQGLPHFIPFADFNHSISSQETSEF